MSRAQSIVEHEEVLRTRVASGVSQVEIYNLDEQFESLREAHKGLKSSLNPLGVGSPNPLGAAPRIRTRFT